MALRIDYNGCDMWKRKATELLNQGGGGGTDDYEDLENKPSINGVELSGNKTAAQLGINIPTKTSDLTNDSGFITKSADDLENYYKKTETDGLLDEKYDKISYVDISEYPYGGTGYYSGVIKIDENYQTGDTREYMALWPDGIRLNFVYQDPDNPMLQRIVRNQLVSNFELWSLHGISKNIQDQIDALPTSDTTYTFSTGDANGEIKVTPSSGSAYNVSVKGLGSAAYADTSAFQAPITGGATTIVSSNLTASRALISNSSGKVAVSAVTSTELGYLDGVTSAIQTQLDGKLPLAGGTMTGSIITNTSSFDLTTAPASSTRYTNSHVWHDKAGNTIARIRGSQNTSNGYYFNFETRRVISDTTYSNNLSFGIASDGTYTVSVNRAAAWRTGLGLGSAATLDADISSTANTVVKRTADKYVYASYFNTSAGNQNPASYTSYPAFISSDGFLRRSTLANFKSYLGLGSVAALDTVPIANGGTGATTRLAALKALTNENVGTNATYFLTITDSWGKGGYTTVANARSVLGVSNLVIARKKAYNVEQVGHRTAIAADTISGYKFLCWVHCSTNGWVGNCYVQDPVASSTYVWNATYSQTLSGSVYVTALYIRDI